MAKHLHDGEIQIDRALVRRLLEKEFPQLAKMPLRRLDTTGSTNVQYRLGDELLIRLPRLAGDGSTIDKECRWLPELSRHLPIDVPEVLAVGTPALGYSERWSIVRWLDGEPPQTNGPDEKPQAAHLASDLADFILALRAIRVPRAASADHQLRSYRGRSLAEYDEQTRRNIAICRSIEDLDLDLDASLSVWENALQLPGACEPVPARWYHGDLVAENLLVKNGRLTGVLDFGGIGVGDPSIDLHGAWELFTPSERQVFCERLGVDEAEWLRGRAWALAIALVTFPYYWTTMPGRIKDRLAMAKSVLADAAEDRARFPRS